MANTTITTSIGASGLYNGVATTLSTSVAAEVLLVDGLTMTITADKTTWIDNDPVTYTITVTNSTDLPFVAPITFTTTAFDPALVEVDPASVMSSTNTVANAAFSAGQLSFELTDDVAAGGTAVATFQLAKVAVE